MRISILKSPRSAHISGIFSSTRDEIKIIKNYYCQAPLQIHLESFNPHIFIIDIDDVGMHEWDKGWCNYSNVVGFTTEISNKTISKPACYIDKRNFEVSTEKSHGIIRRKLLL